MFFHKTRHIQGLIVVVSLMAFFAMVYGNRNYATADTWRFQIVWWDYLVDNGWKGIPTLNRALIGDYTTIWYFIICIFINLGLYPHFPIEYVIKGFAVFCTLLSSVCMFFIAKHFRPESRYVPVLSAVSVLFLPAFLLDIFKTNLPDSIYLMFCLYSFLCFIKGKRWAAWLLLGFGACFKLMAIYLAPVYVYFYLKDFRKYKLSEKLHPLSGLLAVFTCSLPHAIFGGNILYAVIAPIFGRAAMKTKIAFSMWTFLPRDAAMHFGLFSLALTALALVATAFFIFMFIEPDNRKSIEYPLLPTLSVSLCYFFLPSQHEGYFALASIFALIGFIIVRERAYFIIFIILNILLFLAYTWIAFNWWIKNSVFYTTPAVPPALSMIFLFSIGCCYHLIIKKSSFYQQSSI